MGIFDLIRRAPPVVAAVRLGGVIASGGGSLGRRGLNLEHMAPLLHRAFHLPDVKAVALIINSPGGSPAQSDLLARRIRAYATEKKVKVIAYCEDVAASGGYWLACAADEIFALPSSIVGSIGVISAGFGMQGLIERFGVERRVYTAGENKSILDPFKAEDPKDVERLQEILDQTHAQFKQHVRQARGGRLKGDEQEIFSGAFWTGEGALARGLIDGIGDVRSDLRARFGEKVRVHLVDDNRHKLLKRLGLEALAPTPTGALLSADEALATAEERLMWAKYGL
jgi:signal peptide peptidase SppA